MTRWLAIVILLTTAGVTAAQDSSATSPDEVARLRLENAELKQQVGQLQKELARYEPAGATTEAAATTTGPAGVYVSESDLFANFPNDMVPMASQGWNQVQCGVADKWFAQHITARTWHGQMILDRVASRKHSVPPGHAASEGQDYIELYFHLDPSLKKHQLSNLNVQATADCELSQTTAIARLVPGDRVTMEGKIANFSVLSNVGGLSFILNLGDSVVGSVAPPPKAAVPIPVTPLKPPVHPPSY